MAARPPGFLGFLWVCLWVLCFLIGKDTSFVQTAIDVNCRKPDGGEVLLVSLSNWRQVEYFGAWEFLREPPFCDETARNDEEFSMQYFISLVQSYVIKDFIGHMPSWKETEGIKKKRAY